MDFGEAPEDTAKRELFEETGLRAVSIQQYARCPYANTHFRETGKQYITLYFEVIAEGEPVAKEPDKCSRWEWFDPKKLPSPLFAPVEQLDLDSSSDMFVLPVKMEFLLSSDNRIILQFNQSVRWFAMDVAEVRDLACLLTGYADTVEGVETD